MSAGGALIDGEAGVGYRLPEDPALPPQSFSRLEIEAQLVLLCNIRPSQPRSTQPPGIITKRLHCRHPVLEGIGRLKGRLHLGKKPFVITRFPEPFQAFLPIGGIVLAQLFLDLYENILK